ncbi:MAG: glycoside hydrolase family 99-like domain-containing protein [Vitreimonas sp.]
MARIRKAANTASTESVSSGRVFTEASDENCAALRFDFENRLAVARDSARAELAPDRRSSPSPRATAIAFYLPQFHPIRENDAWWGAGFSEWVNVTKAIPQFVGHYQPRLPGELGFYDLRTPGVMAKQADLARAHGVSAFCFHYYWFDGKRLLEAPIETFLKDPSIDIGFCLCWANENWTRRWDGDETDILIAQNHGAENHTRIFADLARHMSDPRYLRVEGRPVLVVYRPDIIDDALAMTEIWRAEARKLGWPGLYLIATNAFGFFEPKSLGFDALAEFPPHALQASMMGKELRWLNLHHAGKVFSYQDLVREEAARLRGMKADRNVPIFPGVMPGWDNEARRPGAGVTYHGATPEAYGSWLAAAADYAERALPPDRRFVFINAWNEWAEGAYLEPDRAHGRAFLAETAYRLLSQ